MSLKDSALDFLRLASSGLVKEVYAKYVHADFIHHNPYFPADRASLMKGMEPEAPYHCRAATNNISA
jgi:hypothetical protein